MADVLRLAGAQTIILSADADDAAINGSSSGQNGISLTGFAFRLFLNGALVTSSTATLQAAPYLLTIDNLGLGFYRLNITLTTAGYYELWTNHSTSMLAYRQEALDIQKTLDELISLGDENTSFEFVKATSTILARKVAIGFLDRVVVKRKRPGDIDWSSPIRTNTLFAHYETLGDENPQFVKEE